jgi:hypothetical protein
MPTIALVTISAGATIMHLIKLVFLAWLAFGVITTAGFLWLCKRSARSLEYSSKKAPALGHRGETASRAIASSHAA